MIEVRRIKSRWKLSSAVYFCIFKLVNKDIKTIFSFYAYHIWTSMRVFDFPAGRNSSRDLLSMEIKYESPFLIRGYGHPAMEMNFLGIE